MSPNMLQTRPEKRQQILAARKRRSKFPKIALRFAKRGFAVFPLQPGAKIPLVKNWGKAATTDLRQIKQWWQKWPDANIGLVTGAVNGIVVIDLDVKNGIDGEANFKALCRKLGIRLPRTYIVETPSGGLHLYFRTKRAGKIRNSAGVLGSGIDIRAEGGYVVAAGSLIDDKLL